MGKLLIKICFAFSPPPRLNVPSEFDGNYTIRLLQAPGILPELTGCKIDGFIFSEFRGLRDFVLESVSYRSTCMSAQKYFTAMGQGRKVPSELQWAVVRLSRLLNHDQIASSLELSTRSIRRIISHFNIHGTIQDPTEDKDPDESNPRSHRHLRDVDVEVQSMLFRTTNNDDGFIVFARHHSKDSRLIS